MVGHVPREISLPIFFNLWKSTSKESKGCEVQGVSNTERYTENPKNAGGGNAPPAEFNKMKDLVLKYYTKPKNTKH